MNHTELRTTATFVTASLARFSAEREFERALERLGNSPDWSWLTSQQKVLCVAFLRTHDPRAAVEAAYRTTETKSLSSLMNSAFKNVHVSRALSVADRKFAWVAALQECEKLAKDPATTQSQVEALKLKLSALGFIAVPEVVEA